MFDWDAANIAHITRHSILPEEAEQVIYNNPLDLERQLRNGEERIPHLGETLAAACFSLSSHSGKAATG